MIRRPILAETNPSFSPVLNDLSGCFWPKADIENRRTERLERPLSVKADTKGLVQGVARFGRDYRLLDDRFTPESRHSRDRVLNDRL